MRRGPTLWGMGNASGSGAEYEAEKAQTKGGAGGGPAEERTWQQGSRLRLLKIEKARTRMRVRDDSFE